METQTVIISQILFGQFELECPDWVTGHIRPLCEHSLTATLLATAKGCLVSCRDLESAKAWRMVMVRELIAFDVEVKEER